MVCYLCRRPIPGDVPWNDPWAFTLDHVVPLSAGGQDCVENLRPAHRECNVAKGDDLGAEYLRMAA